MQESILNAVALTNPERKVEKGKEDEAIGIFQGSEGNTVQHLAVVITTDKGLCGAVNSSLARMVRRELNVAVKSNAANVRVITLGDKGRAQIARDYIPVMSRAIDQAFDKDPIFPLAAALATKIVREPYDLLTLFYNHYENQAKFTNMYKQIPQLAKAKPGSMPATLKVRPPACLPAQALRSCCPGKCWLPVSWPCAPPRHWRSALSPYPRPHALPPDRKSVV